MVNWSLIDMIGHTIVFVVYFVVVESLLEGCCSACALKQRADSA